MTQLLDYHVGIIRGYMLALNAPTQVLHAVEVLLENYHSKAGHFIGKSEEKEHIKAPEFKEPEFACEPEIIKTSRSPFVRWDIADTDKLIALAGEGKTPKEIAIEFPNRNYKNIYSKLVSLNLI